MLHGLVLGMNDNRGSCWALILVTRLHRQHSARSGSSAPRSHRHKAVLSPVALTTTLSRRDDRSGRLERKVRPFGM